MTLVSISWIQPFRTKLFGIKLFKTDYKNDSAVNECIETAPMIEHRNTCVVVVTCAYTHKVKNSYLLLCDESFKTSTSAQKETTVNSDN